MSVAATRALPTLDALLSDALAAAPQRAQTRARRNFFELVFALDGLGVGQRVRRASWPADTYWRVTAVRPRAFGGDGGSALSGRAWGVWVWRGREVRAQRMSGLSKRDWRLVLDDDDSDAAGSTASSTTSSTVASNTAASSTASSADDILSSMRRAAVVAHLPPSRRERAHDGQVSQLRASRPRGRWLRPEQLDEVQKVDDDVRLLVKRQRESAGKLVSLHALAQPNGSVVEQLRRNAHRRASSVDGAQ